MARIFLSHSSKNNAAAIALRDWIIAGGWDEHPFLDLDPERGIAAGERWERALHEEADRCEAVLFLVSREWLKSDWCLKEFNLAQKLNKRLLGVLIDDLPLSDLPTRLTTTWQVVNLASGNDHDLYRVNLPDLSKEEHVTFSRSGLARLKAGLDKAGLDPRFFAWPPENEPDRAPYPGLRPLEAEDAGIFFGCEAPTVVALDRLRGLREAAPPRLLVILGASGAGKSSFLRAGLIPRLTRDDANFLPLPIIRPETAAITGTTGLIHAIQAVFNARSQSLNRADITNAMNGGASQLLPLLNRLAETARAPDISGEIQRAPPALVLSIDQGEELFLAEGAKEAQTFLALLKDLALAGAPNLIALFTIRSDSYERLQTAKALEGVRQETFALPPMPRGAYQTIIEGPVQRLKDSKRQLNLEPALTQALLTDIEEGGGKDALPLLAFTLERLYREYGADGNLLLKEYDALGRIRGSIEAAVDAALKAADSDPTIPKQHSERLALLRRALIPALAGIDPETRAPRRRVARISEIPESARNLINCLVETRLLATDSALDTGETIIEPAHEALLRQWDALQSWLKEDSAALLTLEGVRTAARDWEAKKRSGDWLSHSAGRLEDAERLRQREDFARFITPVDQAYLEACRAQENERRNRELEEARKLADAQKKIAQRTRIGLIAASVLALGALGAARFGFLEADKAQKERRQAEAARAQADQQRQQADTRRQQAETLLAAADELLDGNGKAEQLRQCLASTDRAGSHPPPRGSREFFVGRWHVDQGSGSTDIDWRADGTCESKNIFDGSVHALELKNDVCTWQFQQLTENEFLIDFQSTQLSDNFPKRLRFKIVSPTRIHNIDRNYDAFRIVCPAQELDLYRRDLAALQQRADNDAGNVGHQHDLADGFDKIGIVLSAQGEYGAALKEFAKEMTIRRKLALSDEGNQTWQRDLAISYEQIGFVREMLKQNAAALEAYRSSFAIRQKLYLAKPVDFTTQHDLAAGYVRVAGILKLLEKDRKPSLDAYRKAMQLRLGLADANPGNVQLQEELIESLYFVSTVSDVLEAKNVLTRALLIVEDLERAQKLAPERATLPSLLRGELAKLP